MNSKYSPFLTALIFFIGGICYQNIFTQKTFILFIEIISIFAFLVLFCKTPKVKILIPFLFFYSGSFLFQNQIEKNQIILNKISKNNIDIIGKIKSKEIDLIRKSKNFHKNKIQEILKIQVNATRFINEKKFKKNNFNLLFYIKNKTKIQIGDKIKIKNLEIKHANKQKNSFQNYLLKENILASLFINKLQYKKIDSYYFSINKYIQNKKNQIYKNLHKKLSTKTFNFFAPIFLGHKKTNTNFNLKHKFNYWGITHYLARSGLHIIIFILIWQLFINLIPIHFKLKRLILLLLCTIYLIFSWTSIPFIRAFYIFILYEIGKLLDQQTNFLHLLIIICLSILLINPIQLLFIDFQLSFTLTFILALSNKIILNKKQKMKYLKMEKQ